jgi:hypothetical protein
MVAAGLLALAASACFKDPTSDLRGSPSRLKLSRVYIVQTVGDTDLINIEALDTQGNPHTIAAPTFSSGDATVAEAVAVPDTIGGTLPNSGRWAARVAAKGPGRTVIDVSAGGVTDSVVVVVYPVNFPGTFSVGNGRLLDTLKFAGTSSVKFYPSGANATTITLAGLPAFVVRSTADSMYVIAKRASADVATIANLNLANVVRIASLTTATAVNVDSATTDEANEPGNQSSATATALNITAPGTYFVYGSMNDGAGVTTVDARDYYTFTLAAAPTKIHIELAFTGNGSGDANNADFDVVLCSALSAGLTCTYTEDILGNAASAANQPEIGETSGALAAGQYWIRTYAYATTKGNITYQLKIIVQ